MSNATGHGVKHGRELLQLRSLCSKLELEALSEASSFRAYARAIKIPTCFPMLTPQICDQLHLPHLYLRGSPGKMNGLHHPLCPFQSPRPWPSPTEPSPPEPGPLFQSL